MLPRTNGVAKAPAVPQALPFQAPKAIQEQIQQQIQRLRRWCFLLAAGLGAILVLSVAAFVYFRAAPGAPGAPGAAGDASGKDSAEKKLAKEGPRLAKDEPKPDKEATRPVKEAPKPGKPAVSLKTVPEIREVPPKKISLPTGPTADGKTREPLLETIGGLSTVHLYQTYLNIGLLADAVESETYTRSEAISVLLTVSELIGLVEKQLGKLPATGLSADDEAALEGVRLMTSLLRTQSNALLSFWASGDESHAARYHLAREQTWNALKEVLGLDDE
jgi:hypothetical protein